MRGREVTGAMRAAGGVLLALGALLVLVRRQGHWSDFELLLVLGVPAAALFALAVGRPGSVTGERAESWRAVLLVASVLLVPLALFRFLDWVGAGTRHLLLDAAVLALAAAVAWAGARRARAPYVIFLAGIALLGVWMLVWIKILPHPSGDTVRWLLVGGGAALLLASAAADLAGATGAGELATAGALGAVVAGILGVFINAFSAAFLGLVTTGSTVSRTSGVTVQGVHEHGVTVVHRHASETVPPAFGGRLSGAQTTGWDIYLLIVSLALIVTAARSGRRGPGYVGALGIVFFLVSTAAQLARLGSGHAETHGVLGWPLVLVVLGVAGLAAPLLRRRET